jgi:hypothetical protein
MPNWFNFTLDVNGKEKDVQEFVENVKGSKRFDTEGYVFDFNHFIPQPDNIFRGALGSKEEKYCKDNNLPDWYNWNVENWGTKWNANVDDESGEGTNYHTYFMSTAWADPRPIFEAMFKKYPHLSFEIEGEEESCEYGIYIKFDNGNIVNAYEEEPTFIDEMTNREVYWESTDYLYHYMDNDEAVPDQEDFCPINKYSWN